MSQDWFVNIARAQAPGRARRDARSRRSRRRSSSIASRGCRMLEDDGAGRGAQVRRRRAVAARPRFRADGGGDRHAGRHDDPGAALRPERRRARLARLLPRRRRRDRLDRRRRMLSTRYLAATHAAARSRRSSYRLGPEDKHPAAIDDAFAAWEALARSACRAARRSRSAATASAASSRAHVDQRARERGSGPGRPAADLSARRSDADVAVDRAARRGLPADEEDGALVPRPLPEQPATTRRPARRGSGPT